LTALEVLSFHLDMINEGLIEVILNNAIQMCYKAYDVSA